MILKDTKLKLVLWQREIVATRVILICVNCSSWSPTVGVTRQKENLKRRCYHSIGPLRPCSIGWWNWIWHLSSAFCSHATAGDAAPGSWADSLSHDSDVTLTAAAAARRSFLPYLWMTPHNCLSRKKHVRAAVRLPRRSCHCLHHAASK